VCEATVVHRDRTLATADDRLVEERSGRLLAQAPPPARSSPAADAPQYGEVTDATPPVAAPGPDHRDPGQALAELRDADPVLAALIDQSGPIDVAAWRERWSQGRFESLARGIVGQQISTRAATAIYGRLTAMIGDREPAQAIAGATDDELRLVGLSRAKVASLRDLAARVLDGRLELYRLHELTDAEARSQLIAVRGIGPWTADLFLIGQLDRQDVLPSGDLGLRHAVQALYHLDHVPSPGEVEAIGERWRPNRTLATAYLYEAMWRGRIPERGR
jgi:3-methyladenine DNA glycosylase/8-oxoguanine DNA glycosylase